MEIRDEHVEWAVVDRWRAMLADPPPTEFTVTQSFAFFATTLLWAKNRAWVGGKFPGNRPPVSEADRNAHKTRLELRKRLVCEPPWLLSRPATIVRAHPYAAAPALTDEINSDFVGMTAENFFEWLRDALAHGDGRSIRPIHMASRGTGRTLIGFRIVFEESRGAKRALALSLCHEDIRRLGGLLAEQFCNAMLGDNMDLSREVGSARIEELAWVRP